jgi:hypothetical protein
VPDDALNPYAPPTEEVASAHTAGAWRVEGDYLIVREGTVLPPVDLDGRGMRGPLTPVALVLPVPVDSKGMVFILIPILLILGVMIFLNSMGIKSFGLPGFIGMMVVVQVASRFMPRAAQIRSAPAYVWGSISVPALRRTTRRIGWRQGLTVLAMSPLLLIFVLSMATVVSASRSLRDFAEIGMGIFVVSVFFLLCVAVWSTFDSGWRCVKARDGWVWIKGLGAHALAGLGAHGMVTLPATVKRRVFKIHLQKLPLSYWRTMNALRPIPWLQTLWTRWRRPALLERLCFHWSERRWLTPAQVDPELLADWTREIQDTPLAGWKIIHGEEMDSPGACVRAVEMVLLSPDGLHAAMPAISRVATGRRLQEIRETTFRSWTRDGRIIATGNTPFADIMPDEFDFMLVKGAPWRVAQAHFERTAAEELVAVDPTELRRREEHEMQRRHEATEEAGIYGPTEEMEMPGTWN